jgi:hypothetical protein
MFALIRNHERSITKTRAKEFVLAPIGAVLSSYSPDRHVLAADSFPSIHEFELRDRRIDTILRGGFVDRTGPPGLGPLTVRQQDRLLTLLEKALYQCDRIADLAADHAGGGRDVQMDHIRSLPLYDLVPVYLMISIVSQGWLRAKPYLNDDPNVWESLTVFEECVLRHGSWFLWSQVDEGEGEGGKEAMQEASRGLLRAGLQELLDWETGKEDAKPGLRMTLLEAAKGRLGREEHVLVTAELFKLATAMVKA